MKKLFKALNKSKIFKGLNEQEFAWVLYDVGNSAYTMLACSLIPIWFKNLACAFSFAEEQAMTAGMNAVEAELFLKYQIASNPDTIGMLTQNQATSFYAKALAIVTVIIAILGPICGAIADHKDTRKIFFTTSVAAGVIGCILNGFAPGWIAFLVVYVLAKIFYQASLTFYDSMLNDVTTDERMDEVSSYGYAWGYIGSCIPFTFALIAYVLGPDMVGLLSESVSKIIGFSVTGIWWLLVTLPLIRNYKQINYVEESKGNVFKAFKKLGASLKNIIVNDKKVLFFLIAFFLYIDGVGTIIDHCINIGTALGLDTVGQVVFLLLTQVVAWIGSLVFAKLSKKHSTVSLILVCIVGYFAVCLYALTLKKLWQFGIMAFGVGCFQGSIQSLSRSYFSKIIPDENSGEYFGIYDIFSKGASFLGSVVIAFVMDLPGGNINIAVGSLAIFFALGFIFLLVADKQKNIHETPTAQIVE